MPHTSVRAAYGLFTSPLSYVMYNHMALSAPFSPTYTFNGTASTPISFANPYASYPGTGGADPFPPFVAIGSRPPSTYVFPKPVSISGAFALNFHLGITQSWNASVQQDFGHNLSLQIAYVGSESYHLATAMDHNPGIYATGGTRSTYPNFSSILTNFSNGTSSYNALQISAEKHLSNNLQFQSNFTWSKSIDTWQTGNISVGNSLLPDPFNLRFNRGNSALNVPFIWISNVVYTTPSLSEMKSSILRQTLGGWQVSAIITSQTGTPITVLGGSGNNNSQSQQGFDRANVTGQPFNVRSGKRAQWINSYFNTAAFTTNPAGTFGNSAKNPFAGPPINSTDMGVSKNWTLFEGVRLQFRWEMFNAFNHLDFGVPNSTVGASTFGKITSIGFIPPRVGQLGVKVEF